MSEIAYTKEAVQQRFRDFLSANGHRVTVERIAILDAAYDVEGTFTIEELQQLLELRKFRVSRATLYNTALLMVQANLLIRHPFNSMGSIYEHITDDRPKSFQICNNCHRITRIKSREVAEVIGCYRARRFHITHRVLYIYGICPTCLRDLNKKLKQKTKKPE